MNLLKSAVAMGVLLAASGAHAACDGQSVGTFSFGAAGGTFGISSYCSGTAGQDEAYTDIYNFSTATAFKIDGVVPFLLNTNTASVSLFQNNLLVQSLSPNFSFAQQGVSIYAGIRPGTSGEPAGGFAAGTYQLHLNWNTGAYPVDATRVTAGTAFITAVPEPETYAMMLAGLAIVGAIARRRKAA